MQPVRYSLRVVAPSLAVAIMGLVAACGDSDKGASETLPPISTTTTTTTLAATTSFADMGLVSGFHNHQMRLD